MSLFPNGDPNSYEAQMAYWQRVEDAENAAIEADMALTAADLDRGQAHRLRAEASRESSLGHSYAHTSGERESLLARATELEQSAAAKDLNN